MAEAKVPDPERDEKERSLPPEFTVGFSDTSGRFHLLESGRPVCDARGRIGPVETATVEQARDRGYSACGSCWPRDPGAGLPKRVLVAVRQAGRYHSIDEWGEAEPSCGYSGGGLFTRVSRKKAEKAGLEPCRGCFGRTGWMDNVCPLCGAEYAKQRLNGHLLECPKGAEIG